MPVPVESADAERREEIGALRLRRNITHLVKIIIPRQPTVGVFGLSR
jgi:hypothetical protein